MAGPAIKPRPAPAASVPGLLGLLQAEWDAVALEAHSLRTSLHATRTELAHALYQHDAAVRVIARLTRERDAARAAAAAGGSAAAAAAAAGAAADAAPAPKRAKGGPAGPPPPAPPPAVVAAMTALSQDLAKGRKKRDAHPPGTASAAEAAGFGLVGSPHVIGGEGEGGGGAVVALDAAPPGAGGSALLAVTADGGVAVLDAATGGVARLEGGAGLAALPPAAAAAWLGGDGSTALTAAADGAVRLWSAAADDAVSWSLTATVGAGDGVEAGAALAAVTTHASRTLAAAAGADGGWALLDLSSPSAPTRLLRVVDGAASAAGGYTAARFHPDGVILAAGTAGGAVQVWDARAAGAPAATCEAPPPAAAPAKPSRSSTTATPPIASLAFSENGYYLATGAPGPAGGVRLWDLRKLKHFASPPCPGSGVGRGGSAAAKAARSGAASVAFDAGGSLLAVAGPGGASILSGSKAEWAELASWDAAAALGGGGCAVAWGAPPAAGRALYVGGADGCVRVFSTPA